MFALIKKIFPRLIRQPDWEVLFQEGALLIDVRKEKDFELGHAPRALNIPMNELETKAEKLKKLNVPVIVVCGSGFKSATANEILKDKGLEKVYNGGMWFNFQQFSK
ncbi:MAG: rhodanese-like domain-containing protein [Chitinophagaceae bacterium]|nr:MAG: rhodanese-like domain-containing protein [Chitinophagaceae bacterium]